MDLIITTGIYDYWINFIYLISICIEILGFCVEKEKVTLNTRYCDHGAMPPSSNKQ